MRGSSRDNPEAGCGSHVSPPENGVRFKRHFELLCEMGTVYPNRQAVRANMVMTFLEGLGKRCRLLVYYSPINGQGELMPVSGYWGRY